MIKKIENVLKNIETKNRYIKTLNKLEIVLEINNNRNIKYNIKLKCEYILVKSRFAKGFREYIVIEKSLFNNKQNKTKKKSKLEKNIGKYFCGKYCG